MSKQYANPLFGVEQAVVLPASGALNGTVAATAIAGQVWLPKRDIAITDIGIQFLAGGTAATRQVIVQTALAGTGAATPLGTAVLGTYATGAARLLGITGNVNAGDAVYLTQLGTDAIVYNIVPTIFYVERFTNA